MKEWFQIQIKNEAALARLNIYGHIGGEVSSSALAAELAQLENKGIDTLQVYINSPGGSMFEGNMIYNLIKSFKGAKEAYVIGIAASMASIIAMACDKVYMAGNAQMMIHEPTLDMNGVRAEEMDGLKDMVINMKETAVAAYAAFSGQAEDDISRMMAVTTWMSAARALELGFAHGIIDDMETEAEALAKPYDISAYQFKNVPECIAKQFIKPNEMNPGQKNKHHDNPADVQAVMQQNLELQSRLSALEEERRKEKAGAVVSLAIAQQKIPAGLYDKYLALACADYDTTKAILDSMQPVVKINAQIQQGAQADSSRDSWTYDDWAGRDPKGLAHMKLNDLTQFNTLLNTKLRQVDAKGIVG